MYEFNDLQRELENEISLAKKQMEDAKQIYIFDNTFKSNVKCAIDKFIRQISFPELKVIKEEINLVEYEIDP